MIKTKNVIIDSVKHGAHVAVSKHATDTVVSAVRGALGDSYPDFFDSPIGSAVEPIFVCAALHYLSTNFDGKVPYAQDVAEACELAIEGSAAETFGELISVHFAPLFKQIACNIKQ